MSFQPIVDVAAGRVYAFEALVRGPAGEPAATVLDKVTFQNRYAFDQACRVRAIELASGLGLQQTGASLAINFIPGAMYCPEHCVRATLAAARRQQFPLDWLIFELTENEQVSNYRLLENIFRVYREHGFRVAIDDFGSGFSGLNFLAQFQPDLVKIDMALLRNLDSDARRRAIVQGVVYMCKALSINVVAEGVETISEYEVLRNIGIALMQGFLFARPAFQSLPSVTLGAHTISARVLL